MTVQELIDELKRHDGHARIGVEALKRASGGGVEKTIVGIDRVLPEQADLRYSVKLTLDRYVYLNE